MPTALDRFESRVMPSASPWTWLGTSDPNPPDPDTFFVPTRTDSPGKFDRSATDGIDQIYVPKGGVVDGSGKYSMTFVSTLDVPATLTFVLYRIGSIESDDTKLRDYLFNQMLIETETRTIPAACPMQTVTRTLTICNPLLCNYQIDVFVSALGCTPTGQEVVTQFGANGIPKDPSDEYFDQDTGHYTIIGSIVNYGCDCDGSVQSHDIDYYKQWCNWPPTINELAIGDRMYDKDELIDILRAGGSGRRGRCGGSRGSDPVLEAVQQLIVAKLNIINCSEYGTFACDKEVDRAISSIDHLLQENDFGRHCGRGRGYSGASFSSAEIQSLNNWADILENYNEKD